MHEFYSSAHIPFWSSIWKYIKSLGHLIIIQYCKLYYLVITSYSSSQKSKMWFKKKLCLNLEFKLRLYQEMNGVYLEICVCSPLVIILFHIQEWNLSWVTSLFIYTFHWGANKENNRLSFCAKQACLNTEHITISQFEWDRWLNLCHAHGFFLEANTGWVHGYIPTGWVQPAFVAGLFI